MEVNMKKLKDIFGPVLLWLSSLIFATFLLLPMIWIHLKSAITFIVHFKAENAIFLLADILCLTAMVLFVLIFNDIKISKLDKKKTSLILFAAEAFYIVLLIIKWSKAAKSYFDYDGGGATWVFTILILLLHLLCYYLIFNHYNKISKSNNDHVNSDCEKIRFLAPIAGIEIFIIFLRELLNNMSDSESIVRCALNAFPFPLALPAICLLVFAFIDFREDGMFGTASIFLSIKTAFIVLVLYLLFLVAGLFMTGDWSAISCNGFSCANSCEGYSSSDDYPQGYEECYMCQGSGMVNEGFFDLETCPLCKGSGMIHSHGG